MYDNEHVVARVEPRADLHEREEDEYAGSRESRYIISRRSRITVVVNVVVTVVVVTLGRSGERDAL